MCMCTWTSIWTKIYMEHQKLLRRVHYYRVCPRPFIQLPELRLWVHTHRMPNWIRVLLRRVGPSKLRMLLCEIRMSLQFLLRLQRLRMQVRTIRLPRHLLLWHQSLRVSLRWTRWPLHSRSILEHFKLLLWMRPKWKNLSSYRISWHWFMHMCLHSRRLWCSGNLERWYLRLRLLPIGLPR